MNLRTPLGSVLGLGSAREGTAHFWGQRLSGMALAVLGLWFMWGLAAMPGFSHAQVIVAIGQPINGIFLLLLCGAMAYHSNLGVQVVIEDYVRAHGLKLVCIIVSRYAHAMLLVAAIYSILMIGLNT